MALSRKPYTPNPDDVAWAAGLFEGEGWLTILNSNGQGGVGYPRLGIAMTDKDIIDRWYRVFPFGRRWEGLTSKRSKAGPKPYYFVQVGNQEEIQAILAMLWPWLGERRRAKARLALLRSRQVKARRRQ